MRLPGGGRIAHLAKGDVDMEAGFAFRDTGLEEPARDPERSGLVLLVASAHPECTCPDDCERDHPNE